MTTLNVAEAIRDRTVGRSVEASRLFADLMSVPPEVRRGFLAGLNQADLRQVLTVAARESGTPYGLWADDPVGFITDVLRETLWSKPKEILNAVVRDRRVAVPSCFDSGKTHSSARAVLWHAYTNPVGVAKAVTIAPLWRQVTRQLWPEIRRAHSRAGLPGTIDTAQLKLTNRAGLETVVAYGQSAAPWNESAVQGIHAPRLLLIVDEAGGISPIIGRNLRAMMVGASTYLLAIGNPPTDDEGSWFEGLCGLDSVTTIPISATQTPNLSGERTPRCRSCPEEMPAHTVASHLVDEDWVRDTIAEHGEDSNYVQAKVFARFPRGGPSRTLPAAWVDNAHDQEEPDGDDYVALSSLGLPDETDDWMVRRGPNTWIRLGVDVASDGGDELVIARGVGDLVTIEHVSAGAVNKHSVDVAGVVLSHIRRAEALRAALGVRAPVRVKIDAIGLGWGVADPLRAWGSEGLHRAEIVPVLVSEKTEREPDGATLRPYRKRDEMWLAMRSLIQPRPDGTSAVRLRLDKKALAQLRAPAMGTSSTGHTVIESKKSLKQRGLPSPDRAEGALLVVYEPAEIKRKRARLIV